MCNALALLHNVPTLVGIELRHRGSDFLRRLSKIFLEGYTVLVDDKGHDAGIPILGGIGHNGKSTSHLPVDNVVLRSTFRIPSLFVQHDKVVALKGLMLVGLDLVSFSGSISDQGSERAARRTWR